MNAQEILKNRKMSITENRIKIIECLSDDVVHFHTIAEIAQHCQKINTKSIYNNVKQLIECGIVDSFSFGGISKYALNDNLFSNDFSVHLVSENENIDHFNLSPNIKENIKNAIESVGHKVKTIRVFVDIDDAKN